MPVQNLRASLPVGFIKPPLRKNRARSNRDLLKLIEIMRWSILCCGIIGATYSMAVEILDNTVHFSGGGFVAQTQLKKVIIYML